MQIYLLRHGIAEEARAGTPDADRTLTSEGARKLRDVLKRARSAGLNPSMIFTSPYVRARQTAAIAAQVLGYEEELVPTKNLVPMALPLETWQEIRTVRGETALLLVGHDPHMSSMTGFLLSAPDLMIDFKKGALVRIEVADLGTRPRGVLKWMMAPKLAL